jgi:hypothetical protein
MKRTFLKPALKLFISRGADLSSPDLQERLLRSATGGNKVEMVKFIVEKTNADLHFDRELLLRMAVGVGDVPLISYYLKQGANVHVNNEEPLREAATSGNIEGVELLLKNGASLTPIAKEYTSVGSAAAGGTDKFMEYVRAQNAKLRR